MTQEEKEKILKVVNGEIDGILEGYETMGYNVVDIIGEGGNMKAIIEFDLNEVPNDNYVGILTY